MQELTIMIIVQVVLTFDIDIVCDKQLSVTKNGRLAANLVWATSSHLVLPPLGIQHSSHHLVIPIPSTVHRDLFIVNLIIIIIVNWSSTLLMSIEFSWPSYDSIVVAICVIMLMTMIFSFMVLAYHHHHHHHHHHHQDYHHMMMIIFSLLVLAYGLQRSRPHTGWWRCPGLNLLITQFNNYEHQRWS